MKNAANFQPKYNDNNQLTSSFKYNAMDETLSRFDYTYRESPLGLEYPYLIKTIYEWTVNANIASNETTFDAFKTQANKIEYTYNSSGQVTEVKTYGKTSSYLSAKTEYYSNGLMKSYTNENGVKTSYRYDENSETVIVENTYTTYKYQHGTGALKSISNGNAATTFDYQADGALKTIGHNGFDTNFSYNNGLLQSISVPGRNLVSYDFVNNTDNTRKQDIVKYGNGQIINYNYSNNNLKSISNQNNTYVDFEYNYISQLAQINHTSGVTYKYDYSKNKVSAQHITNNNNTHDISESVSTNVSKKNYSSDTLGANYSYQFKYNSLGQLTNVDRPDNFTTYNYDDKNRLSGINTKINNQTFSHAYDYVIDNTSMTISDLVKNGSSVIGDYTYEYSNGNLVRVKNPKILSAKNGLLAEYRYDQYNRLQIEKNYLLEKRYIMIYDEGGNITSKEEHSLSSSDAGTLIFTHQYSYPSTGWKDLLSSYSGQPIIYDIAGNPVSYRGASMTWKNGRQLATYKKDTAN